MELIISIDIIHHLIKRGEFLESSAIKDFFSKIDITNKNKLIKFFQKYV